MSRRRNRHPGRIRIKLADLLTKALTASEGFDIFVDACDFWRNEGALSHATHDLASWGLDLEGRDPKGVKYFFSVHSWDKMTDCVRYGFSVVKCAEQDFGRSLPGDREICAIKTSH